MCDALAEERSASWRRGGRGISSNLHALYARCVRASCPIIHKCSKATRRRGRHCSVAWVRVQAQVDCRCGGGRLQRERRPLRWVAADVVASAAPGADVPAAAAAYGYLDSAALAAAGPPVVLAVVTYVALAAAGPPALDVDGGRRWCFFRAPQCKRGPGNVVRFRIAVLQRAAILFCMETVSGGSRGAHCRAHIRTIGVRIGGRPTNPRLVQARCVGGVQ